jgi:hypothetical protein
VETILKGLGQVGAALLPSVYAAVFLYARYPREDRPLLKSPFSSEVLLGFGPYLLDLSIFLVGGIFIYYFHRGVLHRLIWAVQRRTYGVPQFDFHQMVCDDEPKIDGIVREKITLSQACLYMCQIAEPPEYQYSTESFNTGSHLLYMNSLMFFLFGIHDLSTLGRVAGLTLCGSVVWGAGFIILAVLFGWVALKYDQMADYREIVYLTQPRDRYRKIVMNVFEHWGRHQNRKAVRGP